MPYIILCVQADLQQQQDCSDTCAYGIYIVYKHRMILYSVFPRIREIADFELGTVRKP
jgi:hypothetical protein